MFRGKLRLIILGIVGVWTALALSVVEAAAPPKAAPPPKPAPPKAKIVHHRGRTIVTSGTAPLTTRRFGVEVRSPGWQHRTFTNSVAARSFYNRLGRMHFQRSIKHNAGGAWLVKFRARSWHRYVTTTNKPAAERLAVSLRAQGLHVRVRGL
jgi:hypothetical protein